MKLNLSKLAAVLIGSLVVLWGLALFFGFPFLYHRKVEALVGQDLGTVRRQLGPPTQEWRDQFACAPALPCSTDKAQGGPVLLYSDGAQGWYLYFDRGDKLASLEAVRPNAAEFPQPKLPLR